MTVVDRPSGIKGSPVGPDATDADLLFREAKRRERQRRLRWTGAAVIVIAGATTITVATRSTTKSPPPRPRVATARLPVLAVAGAIVVPEHPYAMAVGPGGTLFVVDSERDQVLRRTSTGQFQVVAGTGRRGFSGDGSQAVSAKINVDPDSGIAVAKNGTVYFADTSNARVREVLPDGIIRTVIGGGSRNPTDGVLRARQASLRGLSAVAGLAIGPDGNLYVAAGAVYRLETNGMLRWIVGRQERPTKDFAGIYANPAIQLDFMSSSRIAFDGKGDLLDAGGGGWGLYERTASGKLRFVENFRGDGFWGSLASGPDGTVALVSGGGLSVIHPSGALTDVPVVGLSEALGMGVDHPNAFIGGDGIAVGQNGVIYVDTNTGNTFTTVSAILSVSPNGTVGVVWKS